MSSHFSVSLGYMLHYWFCRPKKWNEHLQKPQLDYSEIFDEDVGQIPGQLLWMDYDCFFYKGLGMQRIF